MELIKLLTDWKTQKRRLRMLNNLTNNTGSTWGSNTTQQIEDLCNCLDCLQVQVNCNSSAICSNTSSISNMSCNVCTVNVNAQSVQSNCISSNTITASEQMSTPEMYSECFTTGDSSMTDSGVCTPVLMTNYICSGCSAVNVCSNVNTLGINATGDACITGSAVIDGNTRIKGALTLDCGSMDINCINACNACAKCLSAESASAARLTGTSACFTNTVQASEVSGTSCVSTACVKSDNIQNTGKILTDTSCSTGTMQSTHIISSDIIDATASGGSAYTILTIPKFSGEVSFYTDLFRFTVRDNVDITYEDSANQAHILYMQYVPSTGETNIALKDAAKIGYAYDISNINDITISKSYSSDTYPTDIYTYTNLNQYVKKGHVMIYENVSGANEGVTILGNFYATNWTMPQSMSYEVFIAQKLGIGECLYSLDNSCVCIDLCSKGISIDNCGDTNISSANVNETATTKYTLTAPAICFNGLVCSACDITAPAFHGTADKVANKLTINQTVSGTTTYDGSAPVSIDLKNSKLTTGYTTDVAATTAATEYDGSADVTNTYYKPDQNVNIASKVVFGGITDTGDLKVSGGTVNVTSTTGLMTLTGDQGITIGTNNSKDIQIIAVNYDTTGSYILVSSGDATVLYSKAPGTFVTGTTYYTDNTGATPVDTSTFVAGTTDVSAYYIKDNTLKGYSNVNNVTDIIIASKQVGVKADVIGLDSGDLQISNGVNTYGTVSAILKGDTGAVTNYVNYINDGGVVKYVFSSVKTTAISGVDLTKLSTIYANLNSSSVTAANNVTVTTATGNSTFVQAPQYKFNILTTGGTAVESTLTIDENKNLVFNGVKVLSQDDYDVIWKRLLALEAKVEAFSSNADASTELTDDIIKNWTGKTDISEISH